MLKILYKGKDITEIKTPFGIFKLEKYDIVEHFRCIKYEFYYYLGSSAIIIYDIDINDIEIKI